MKPPLRPGGTGPERDRFAMTELPSNADVNLASLKALADAMTMSANVSKYIFCALIVVYKKAKLKHTVEADCGLGRVSKRFKGRVSFRIGKQENAGRPGDGELGPVAVVSPLAA